MDGSHKHGHRFEHRRGHRQKHGLDEGARLIVTQEQQGSAGSQGKRPAKGRDPAGANRR